MHNSGKMSPNGIASLTWFSIECKCFTMQCLMMAHTNEQLNLNCQTVQVGRMFIEQLASFHWMHKISISFILCNHLYLPWPIKENVFRLFQYKSALVWYPMENDKIFLNLLICESLVHGLFDLAPKISNHSRCATTRVGPFVKQ